MVKNGDMGMKDANSEDGRDGRDRSRSPLAKRDRRDWDREHRGGARSGGGDPGNRRGGGGAAQRPRIYIANIPYDMRWQEVKDLFKEKVSDVTYVDLFEDNEGKSIGAGVVEFRDPEAADNAIREMNRYELRGRRIIVREEKESDRRRREKMLRDQHHGMGGGNDMGMPMGGGGGGGGGGMGMMPNMPGPPGPMGGPAGMPGPNVGGGGRGMMDFPSNSSGVPNSLLQQLGIEGPVTNQLFVANLDYSVNDNKLREVFGMAGRVVTSDLKTDKEGKSRGFGTVTMDNALEAVQAISMFNGQLLYDRPMSVHMDKESQGQREPSKSKLPSGLRGVGMGLGSSGQALRGNQLQGILAGSGNNATPGNLGNVGMGLGLSGLSGLTNLAGGALGSGNLNAGALGDLSMTGGLTGLGNLGSNLAGLSNLGGNASGLASGLNLGGVGLGGIGDNLGGGGGGMGGGSMRGEPNMRGGNTGGRNSGMEDTSIFVRHIPVTYTWKDLKDLFMDIGEIKYAAVKMEMGKSKCCGTVRFASADDARRAVNFMNGYRLQGRSLEVYIDRK